MASSDRRGHSGDPFRLSIDARRAVWDQLAGEIEAHWSGVDALPVAPVLDPAALRRRLATLSLESGISPDAAISFVVDGLRAQQVHTAHPRYFGLYNPSPATMGVVGDALVAAFNPQLAAWSHSPFAAEVEAYLIRCFAERFGFPADHADGVFTSGGAEANHTGVLAALVHAFPTYREQGLSGLGVQPTMYVTAESHDSLAKAASVSGIGLNGVRVVPTTNALQLDTDALEAMIRADRESGLRPFLVVATAGTTSAGIIDPIIDVADVAKKEGLWLHVDAAWGGAAVLSPNTAGLLSGIEQADSITFDAHKWLSVPMGAGMFITRHPDILDQTFATNNTYMPRDAAGLGIVDPFNHSIQWSRRFTGLKLFLTLAVAGWDGYAGLVDQFVARGDALRQILVERGWLVANQSPLPVVCVRDPDGDRTNRTHIDRIVQRVVSSGRAWISSAVLSDGTACIRACITNFETSTADLIELADALDDAREA